MGKKCDFDKFYTNPNIVSKLLSEIDFDKYDLVIEPSAGNGSFSNQIENIVALDLKPECDGIIEQNWFDYKISSNFNKVLVIGNPPFGNRNNLSKQFIDHALSFDNVHTIAFILPNVYNKYTNQKMFSNEWRLAKTIPLEKDSFLLNGEPYHVPCSFFVWTKEQGLIDLRFNIDKYKSTPDFDIVSKDKADFFVMGNQPKTIKKISEVSSTNRGYYIKSNIGIEKLKNILKSIEWKNFVHSSVNGGVAWLSTYELIKIYEENKPI